MPRLGKEESSARANEKSEGDDDMEYLMEGNYRSDSRKESSDSDDNTRGEDKDHQQGKEKYDDSVTDFDKWLREFDKQVAARYAEDIACLFGNLTLKEESTTGDEATRGDEARVKENEEGIKDNESENSARKKEQMEAESENAKRKKEQLEAAQNKKLKSLQVALAEQAKKSLRSKEEG